MTEKYVSSIINQYGDSENVKKDIIALNDIIERQGTKLLTDVLAEYVGKQVLKFRLNESEATNLRKSIVSDLDLAMLERI